MSYLANKLDKKTAFERLRKESFSRRTVSFYRYVNLPCVRQLRDELFRAWSAIRVLGRVYLAEEGINAQVSCPEPHWEMFCEHLFSFKEFKSMPFKFGLEEGESFWKLAIKVKPQIVADGLPAGSFDPEKVGKHLSAREFHEAMDDPESIVVDMRNHYESRVGRFEGALCPDADTFREELPLVRKLLKGKEDKKILLYCTGGIRCEKASAYLRHAGFLNVNQLYGGIVAYKREVDAEGIPSRFKGKNYVFDARGGERVTEDVLASCDQCGKACDTYVNCANLSCNLLFLQCAECQGFFDGCCSPNCRKVLSLPKEEYQKYRQDMGKQRSSAYYRQLRPKIGAGSGL